MCDATERSLGAEELENELVDALVARYGHKVVLEGPEGVLGKLTKKVVERALAAELTAPRL